MATQKFKKSKGASCGKKRTAPAKIDLGKETERDWECATRFNKLIWSKWPKSIDSIRGLCEWLEKKGYVVRMRMPMSRNAMHTRRWAMDLLIDEEETIFQIFHPTGMPEDEKVRERLLGEYRMAQRSGLVCTTHIDEFDGNSLLFALFREKGTTNCLVFVTYSSI